ncbi:hypothetical protein [Vibrio sp. YIC-376]
MMSNMDKTTMASFFQQRVVQSHSKLEVMALIHLNEMFHWT